MRGLGVRVARGVNRVLDCSGRVIGDRYHARALRTPREVRNALRYVLLNFRKHSRSAALVDRASSGAAFDGWSRAIDGLPDEEIDAIAASVVPAALWLTRIGWRRHGRIDPTGRPSTR